MEGQGSSKGKTFVVGAPDVGAETEELLVEQYTSMNAQERNRLHMMAVDRPNIARLLHALQVRIHEALRKKHER